MVSGTSSSRRIAEFSVLVLGPVAAILGFSSIAEVFSSSDGDWLRTILLFMSFGMVFFSASALLQERWMKAVFSALSFFPSVLLFPSFSYFGFALFSSLVLFSGFQRVERDIHSRLTLSFRRSLSLGALALSFSLALLLSGAYYENTRYLPWSDLVPKFSLAKGGGDQVLRVVGVVYPELSELRDDEVTVDMFLSDIVARQTGDSGAAGLLSGNALADSLTREVSLGAGRKQLEGLVGRPLSGDEKMADVLSEVIRHKTLAFLSGAQAEHGLPSGVLPFFLSLLLFLTVLSVGSVLSGVLVWLSVLLLRFLLLVRVLSIEKIPAEQEVLW